PRVSPGVSFLRQREHVQRLAARRRLDFGSDQVRNEPWAAAAEARRHGHVLLAVDLEADRETLHRRREPRLPQDPAVANVYRLELAIEIANEHDAAGRR